MTVDLQKPCRSAKNTVDMASAGQGLSHTSGWVQSFGAVIALTPDSIIGYYSANLHDFIDSPNPIKPGTHLSAILSSEGWAIVEQALSKLRKTKLPQRYYGIQLCDKGLQLDVTIRLSGDNTVIDLEHHMPQQRIVVSESLQPAIDSIRQAATINLKCQQAAKALAEITGYDRVLVYRHTHDGTGSVITETAVDGMHSILGLHYSATAVTKQARNHYCRNLIHFIVDIDDESVPITPLANGTCPNIDLGVSELMAATPAHLAYLRSMGISAKLSVAIIVEGQLWGLLGCQHRSPMLVNPEVRSAAKMIGQFLGLSINELERAQDRVEQEQSKWVHDKIMVELAKGEQIENSLDAIANIARTALDFDSVICWAGNKYSVIGESLTLNEFLPLLEIIQKLKTDKIYATKQLSTLLPSAVDHAERVAGILVLPLSRQSHDYLLFCRKAVPRSIIWASDPDTTADDTRSTELPTFTTWKEDSHDKALPWQPQELRAAEALRLTMLEVVLRMKDQAAQNQEAARKQQEVLIAELNHRVRNILQLIRNLVVQSNDGIEDVEQFTRIVGGRIQALAQAHDLITRKNWEPSSIEELIQKETRAFLGQQANRVSIEGTEVLISPLAFTTMALVIHELVTNAAKYGALSNDSGVVKISLKDARKRGFHIHWQEIDGPKVRPPTRSGFGSTIIERSIPFELQGKSDISFHEDGFQALLTIPPQHITRTKVKELDNNHSPEITAPVISEESDKLLSGNVLLVEDTMLLALGAERHLMKLGAARVFIASNVSNAKHLLNQEKIEFCLLDVNLEGEISSDVAWALHEKGIPFGLATGYGAVDSLLDQFPPTRLITKPYDLGDIASLIMTIRDEDSD